MYRLNELGNSRRFIAVFGPSFRYVHDWKTWVWWDGKVWSLDGVGMAEHCAKDIGEVIRSEADGIDDEKAEAAYLRAASKAETVAGIKAILRLASTEPEIAYKSTSFDQQPNLLNTMNGTINLLTGDLAPHKKTDYLTQMIHVNYDPDAGCKTWLKFLNRIFDNDQAMIAFLRRAVGSSLTGSVRDQKMFLCYGTGANGKSVFLNTLNELFGAYSSSATPGAFDERRANSGGPRDDLARLRGVRMVITTENKKGTELDAEGIKRMTGGDEIVARHLYGREFIYQPQFKIWFAANTLPPITEATHGIWRRVLRLNFKVKIPEHEQIDYDQMMENLRAEHKGILAWAVQGAVEWAQEGLNPPAVVTDATNQYQMDQDRLADFIEDECEKGEDKRVLLKDLTARHEQWATRNGIRLPWLSARMKGELIERDYIVERKTGNNYYVFGLDLKPDMRLIPSEGEWQSDYQQREAW